MNRSIVFLVFLTIMLTACGSNLTNQSDPTPSESLLSPTPSEDLILPTPSESTPSPSPSEEAQTSCYHKYPPPLLTKQPTSETSTSIASKPNGPAPKILTKREIFDLEVFHADWTKKQMENIGLLKEGNDQSGNTCYHNESIAYIYFDFDSLSYSTSTPFSITVFGEDITGPRGLRIGDTFEEVMALFPQEQDWESNEDGVFYGTYNADAIEPLEPAGRVTTYYGFKQIDLLTGEGPFIRMDFPGDLLTQYTVYMYLGT